MAEHSKIEWCHHTMNFWLGCTALSAACDYCYAEGWAKRTGNADLWKGNRRRTSPALWRQAAKWNARSAETGIRERVFTNSLADFFDNQVPADWRNDAWVTIAAARHLDWMLLTKRPENIGKMLPVMEPWQPGYRPWNERWPWRNVWLGTTVESRSTLRRIEALRRAPAAIHFLSIEPLLEDLGELDLRGIDLVIVGGESGPKSRPMHPQWVRSIRDQCAAAGVAFFFKQWGEWVPDARRADWSTVANDDNLLINDPRLDVQQVSKVGKKAAGRLLDGVEHNGMPEARHAG